uniref:MSP domain-containing protein n=1 Tax=Acrobeloides nanus TaxID=290746 RepID=A0A914CIE6_9BILA
MEEHANESFPVFVNPSTIQFILNKRETLRQVVSLYNPYNFDYRYRVLSNAPNKYVVSEANGFVRAGYYMDILIRRVEPTPNEVGSSDTLRVEIYKDGDHQRCGKKDIPLSVLSSSVETDADRVFRSFPGTSKMPPEQRQQRHVSFAHSEAGDIPARPAHANFYWLAVMALGACLATLLVSSPRVAKDFWSCYFGSMPPLNVL